MGVELDGPGDPLHPCSGPVDGDSQIGLGGSATPCHSACGSTSGAFQVLQRLFGDPVDAGRGALVETVTDMSVASRGPALRIARTYDSAAAREGMSGVFGAGWSSLLDSSLTADMVGSESTAVWRQPSGAKVSFVDEGSEWRARLSGVTATLSMFGGQFEVATDDGTVYRFEPGTSGVLRLVQVVDRNGYVLSLTWSASQLQLVSHANPGAGAASAYSLTVGLSAGRVVQVRDPAGRKVLYSYSGDDLVSVSSLGGGSWQYSYADPHLLTNLVEPSGGETVTSYDESGRVAAQWDPKAVAAGTVADVSAATQFAYEGFDAAAPLTGTTTITGPDGSVTEQLYGSGLLIGERQGVGTAAETSWQFGYDAVSGLVTGVVAPNKAMSLLAYTEQGWLSQEVSPSWGSIIYSNFDPFGNPGAVKDQSGVTTTYAYDVHGNVVSVGRPWGSDTATTTFVRSSFRPDDVMSVTAPDGTTTNFTYLPGSGQVASTTDPAGGKRDCRARRRQRLVRRRLPSEGS